MRRSRPLCYALLSLVVLSPTAFGAEPKARPAGVRLAGGGATFALPLYTRWFAEYRKGHPQAEVTIDYQPFGSAKGTELFFDEQLDFAGTDVPLSDGQVAKAKVKCIHLPVTLGAVVPIYNLPGLTLRFSGEVLALIFLGKVTSWDDALIAGDNPGVKLPRKPITVVHRKDSSGITYVWTDFLSKISPEFKEAIGTSNQPTWSGGRGALSNSGVVTEVNKLPGAIGYVELTHALKNKISFGAVKNAMGEFVLADYKSVTAAAAAVRVPSDYRASIVNPRGKGAYPVSFYTFLLVNLFMQDQAKSHALKDLLKWIVTEGQGFNEGLGFARLPADVARREVLDIASLK